MTNFLSCDGDDEMNAMFKNIMSQNPESVPQELRDKMSQPQSKRVIPKPGMCIKTSARTEGIDGVDQQQKMFLNICTSEEIPAPEPKTIEEIRAIIERLHDPTYTNFYRIPMSVGEGHAEIDNSGNGCVAYDIIVHPKFFSLISAASGDYYIFFLELIREKLEDKYNMLLDSVFKVLKNRKCLGVLNHQFIRSQSKPFIQEIQRNNTAPAAASLASQQPAAQNKSTSQTQEPHYTLIQEPLEGHPDYIIAEVQFPNVQTADGLSLQIGEDRILVTTRSNLYELDLYLPFDLVTSECGAQFNRNTKVLTLTLPVVSV